MHCRQAGALVVAVAIVYARCYCSVTPLAAQPAEQLHLCAGAVAVAIAQRASAAAVHSQQHAVHSCQPSSVEGIVDVLEGVVVERCRRAEAAAVVVADAYVRAERQYAQRVDVPLHVHVCRPAVLPLVALADAVRECSSALCLDEVLRPRAAPVVGVAAVPRHSSAGLQVPSVLVAYVQCRRLRLALAVVVAASSSATPCEVSVVHVVGIAHECVSDVAEGLHGRQAHAVAVVGAVAHVGVHLQSASCAALGDELEHEVLVAVVYASQLCQVALLVVCLHLVYDVRRQVLHHGVVVARHEVASVHLESLDVLSVYGYASVVVDLCPGQGLHECFYDRAFRHAECVGIVYYCVVLDYHLRQVRRCHGLAEQYGVGRHCQRAHVEGLARGLRYAVVQLSVAHV